ncbi:hypothetical protein FQZ97_1083010 [compost metagenome]
MGRFSLPRTDARIVHQHIETAVAPSDMLRQRLHSHGIADVAAPHFQATARVALGPGPFKLKTFQVSGDNLRAFLGETQCDRPANTSRGPRDQCDLAGNSGHGKTSTHI